MVRLTLLGSDVNSIPPELSLGGVRVLEDDRPARRLRPEPSYFGEILARMCLDINHSETAEDRRTASGIIVRV